MINIKNDGTGVVFLKKNRSVSGEKTEHKCHVKMYDK
jgi:hypothetical protein